MPLDKNEENDWGLLRFSFDGSFVAIYLPKSIQFGGLEIGTRAVPIYNIPLRNLATFF